MSSCGNAAPAGARDPVFAGEYKILCTECRHFARDVFSFLSLFLALTLLSRSEFSPGPGPHAFVVVMSRHLPSRPRDPVQSVDISLS